MPPKPDKGLEEMRRRIEDMGALRLQCKMLLENNAFSMLGKHDAIWYYDPEEPEIMQDNLDCMRQDLIKCFEIICDMWDTLSEGL